MLKSSWLCFFGQTANKCIGDDTKAAARQSSNCIKNNNKNTIWRKTIFQYGGWNYYTLQRGTIMTLTSPGDCTLRV